jgi:hypothetical protein
MSDAEKRQNLTPEELEAQEAEELPEREAMSVLEPPLPLRPMPLDGIETGYVPPESA